MSDLHDVRGGTTHFTSAALAVAGADTQYDTTGTQTYSIQGLIYTVAAKSAVEVPDVDGNTNAAFTALANGKQCVFVFCWNAAGNAVVCQGPIENTADVVANSEALHFPQIPDNACPFAYFTVANANATPWLFGTGLWNASNLTIGTVRNVAWLPARPLTAAS